MSQTVGRKRAERTRTFILESKKNHSSTDTESFASADWSGPSGGLTGWTVAVLARKFGQNGIYFQNRLPFENGFP